MIELPVPDASRTRALALAWGGDNGLPAENWVRAIAAPVVVAELQRLLWSGGGSEAVLSALIERIRELETLR